MVQLNLNFTHACRHMYVLACLTRAKLQKLVCAYTVACDFGVRTWDSKYVQHTRDAHHELALGLPHYTCVRFSREKVHWVETIKFSSANLSPFTVYPVLFVYFL